VHSTSSAGWAKVNGAQSSKLLSLLKLSTGKTLAALCMRQGECKLVVPKTAGYYIAAYPSELDRTKQTILNFSNDNDKNLAFVLINSNIFFWYWRIYGDGFDVTSGDITNFPLINLPLEVVEVLANKLLGALNECTVYKQYRGIPVPNVNFNKRLDITLEIDETILRSMGSNFGEFHPSLFLRGKSNSLSHLEIPKSENIPIWAGVSGAIDEE